MPRMLDLFCGRFGWSKAFAARTAVAALVATIPPGLSACVASYTEAILRERVA